MKTSHEKCHPVKDSNEGFHLAKTSLNAETNGDKWRRSDASVMMMALEKGRGMLAKTIFTGVLGHRTWVLMHCHMRWNRKRCMTVTQAASGISYGIGRCATKVAPEDQKDENDARARAVPDGEEAAHAPPWMA